MSRPRIGLLDVHVVGVGGDTERSIDQPDRLHRPPKRVDHVVLVAVERLQSDHHANVGRMLGKLAKSLDEHLLVVIGDRGGVKGGSGGRTSRRSRGHRQPAADSAMTLSCWRICSRRRSGARRRSRRRSAASRRRPSASVPLPPLPRVAPRQPRGEPSLAGSAKLDGIEAERLGMMQQYDESRPAGRGRAAARGAPGAGRWAGPRSRSRWSSQSRQVIRRRGGFRVTRLCAAGSMPPAGGIAPGWAGVPDATAGTAPLAWSRPTAAAARRPRRIAASPTHTIRVPALAASATAAWLMRAPGSSIRHAIPPIGRCVLIPVLSTTTNAPSRTSTLPFSTQAIDARSFSGIGLGGGRPGSLLTRYPVAALVPLCCRIHTQWL